MNIELSELIAALASKQEGAFDNGMVGRYVLVRCRDAGVHTGILVAHRGRECTLREARRLWKWKASEGGLLSSVAEHGLSDESSIVAEPQELIHLTETCEISLCSSKAETSIRACKNSHR